jgi:hypothetical protein
MTTTRTLTKEDKACVARIISGARHIYLENITHAKTPEERNFYQERLAEAERLLLIFNPTDIKVAVIEEDEDEEESSE